MSGLDLPYPQFIDYAVPGKPPLRLVRDDLPEQMREYCRDVYNRWVVRLRSLIHEVRTERGRSGTLGVG